MLISDSLWITGSAKSGKTEALIVELMRWAGLTQQPIQPSLQRSTPQSQLKETAFPSVATPLIFAANADNRLVLRQRIAQAMAQAGAESEPFLSTTPLGFFEREVLLFWPLVIQQLDLRGYFPYRLRPEAEQVLVKRVWTDSELAVLQAFEPSSAERWRDRILDLIKLAAASGTPLQTLALKLSADNELLKLPQSIAEQIQILALKWKDWCLHRGLLTYSLVTDVFSQHVLSHPTYLQQIPQRFSLIAADDVDNYPAVAKRFFEQGMNLGLPGIFTYSPTGSIRKGLGADPEVFLALRERCTQIPLPDTISLPLPDEMELALLPDQPLEVYTIQTVSRTQLLQDLTHHIVTAVQSGDIQPQDIAIIGPGLDPIARYILIDRLQSHGISVEPLREQRPLQSSAIVRALLTLLALVYPGLGHWIEAEQVAEMLGVLTSLESPEVEGPYIDPVRAGLLADYCFRPHPERPELLPIEAYLRWDRLGYQAAHTYERIRQWIAQQQGVLAGGLAHSGTVQTQPAQTGLVPQPSAPYLTLSPVFVLDRAIQTFLMERTLSFEQIAVLRQLIETAQHYWEVDDRLRKTEPDWPTVAETLGNFIQLLRSGVITSNPYLPKQQARTAVTLANSYQYLNARHQHRWQYWLDAGSQLWHYGGEVDLWGSALFLTESEPRSPAALNRLNATLSELVHRAQDRLYLCHSELATNGQTQMGPLIPWIEAGIPTERPEDEP